MLYLGTWLLLTLLQSLKQSRVGSGNQEESCRSRKQRILEISVSECHKSSWEQHRIKASSPSLRSASNSRGKTHSGLTCFTPCELNTWDHICCIWNNPKDSLKPFKRKNSHFCHLLNISKCGIFPAVRDDTESLSVQTNTDTKNQWRDFLALEKGRW